MNNTTQAPAFAHRRNRSRRLALLCTAMLACAAASFAQSTAPAGNSQQRGPATLQPAAGSALDNGVTPPRQQAAADANGLRIAPASKGSASAVPQALQTGNAQAATQAVPATPPVEDIVRFLTGAEPLQPPRDIARTGYWQANAHWLAPSLGGLLIAVGLIIWALYRRSRRPVVQSPQLLALQAIAIAEGHGEDKRFASAVSDAVRGYLEARFQLRAPEQTTEEFLRDARNSATLPAEAVQALAHLLQLCDLAKFARQGLSAAQRTELSETARQLVQALGSPQPPEGQPPAAAAPSAS